MTIVELRTRQNALAVRFAAIAEAIETIRVAKVIYTKTLADAAVTAWRYYYGGREGYEHTDPPDYHRLVGTEISVWDEDVLLPLIEDGVKASNIEHYIASITKLTASGPPTIETLAMLELAEPVTEHWLPEELACVQRSYRSRITAATTAIRNINTTWKYLSQQSAKMPDFIKSQLMGLFGAADHGSFVYVEEDFKWQDRNKQPKVMTARFLAPFIGLVNAVIIEQAMCKIEWESAPRPGEPPTLDGFGSHVSNAIKVFAHE